MFEPAAVAAKAWRFDLTGGASARRRLERPRPRQARRRPRRRGAQAGAGRLPGRCATVPRPGHRQGRDPRPHGSRAPDPGRRRPGAAFICGDGPLFANSAGSFHLTTSGGGLPGAELTVPRYVADASGVHGQARLAAKGSIGPVVEGETDLSGAFRLAGGALDITADRCAPVSAARLELGINDVEAIEGEFCPAAQPTWCGSATAAGGRMGRSRT